MANNKQKKKKPGTPAKLPFDPEQAPWPRRLGQEVAALLLLGLTGFCFLALLSHSSADPQGLVAAWSAPGVSNLGGKAGAVVSGWAFWLLGLAAFWLPPALLALAWQSHRVGLDQLSPVQSLAG